VKVKATLTGIEMPQGIDAPSVTFEVEDDADLNEIARDLNTGDHAPSMPGVRWEISGEIAGQPEGTNDR
jgi:hypothetical protein